MKNIWIPIVLILAYLHSAKSESKFTDETITFTQNIRPILQSNCTSCHPGIVNYSVAFQQKDKILKKVTSKIDKQMPPQYISPRLTTGEVELIKQWVKTGAKK
jgi:hypothetical protein